MAIPKTVVKEGKKPGEESKKAPATPPLKATVPVKVKVEEKKAPVVKKEAVKKEASKSGEIAFGVIRGIQGKGGVSYKDYTAEFGVVEKNHGKALKEAGIKEDAYNHLLREITISYFYFGEKAGKVFAEMALKLATDTENVADWYKYIKSDGRAKATEYRMKTGWPLEGFLAKKDVEGAVGYFLDGIGISNEYAKQRDVLWTPVKKQYGALKEFATTLFTNGKADVSGVCRAYGRKSYEELPTSQRKVIESWLGPFFGGVDEDDVMRIKLLKKEGK
jgi:hypothetical protein